MHRRIRAYLAIPLVMLLSVAPALTRMTCQMSGRSELRMGAAEDCCPGHSAHERDELAPICCLSAQVQLKAGSFVHPLPLHLPSVELVLAEMPVVVIPLADHARVRPVTERPPPLTAPERAAFTGVLLI
ncbi:MAG: hypothetical protein H6595_04540 [Flavobacteriales bacterium]|nr:hypothetical protein [Flavobacteriales bacterium]MCB9166729.1 hypothetical protein [Flavobacteriales bacterium]MCB9171175.1 hypothetical protein [Flavobacteriales bacterium]